MFLGIEIGGMKLQLGVGRGDGALVALARLSVDPRGGAEGIRQQLARAVPPLLEAHQIAAVGFGFGGPVDAAAGRTIVSHQIEGWRDFPLVDWARRTFGLPALLANDSDSAGLAEARFGAGREARVVFYSNVGSGIGGALVIDGQLYQGGSGLASEPGHLRPGLDCQQPEQTVESLASGWAITALVRDRLAQDPQGRATDVADLLHRCDGDRQRLSTQLIAQAAASGNRLAVEALDRACRVFGWALAQMVTLVAPNVVVVGGGVSLIGEALWLAPLRRYVRQYVFPPLRDAFEVRPAQLGEEVVVHGVLALLSSRPPQPASPA